PLIPCIAGGIDDEISTKETAARARTRAGQSRLDPAVAARYPDSRPVGAVPAARLHLIESGANLTMLVQFKSPATETITMFDGDAVQLLKLMGATGRVPRVLVAVGATGRVPGGLSEQDVPGAMQRLESAVEGMNAKTHGDTAAPPADNEDWASDADKDPQRSPPIKLETGAIPLLSLLKRAAAAKVAVTWEGGKKGGRDCRAESRPTGEKKH